MARRYRVRRAVPRSTCDAQCSWCKKQSSGGRYAFGHSRSNCGRLSRLRYGISPARMGASTLITARCPGAGDCPSGGDGARASPLWSCSRPNAHARAVTSAAIAHNRGHWGAEPCPQTPGLGRTPKPRSSPHARGCKRDRVGAMRPPRTAGSGSGDAHNDMHLD